MRYRSVCGPARIAGKRGVSCMTTGPDSPFLPQTKRRLTFGTDWVLLLTVVAAATATLVGYALFLPAVTNEFNAWMGATTVPADDDGNRRAQIVFLMLCYAAPMILGLMARMVQLAGQKLARRLAARDEDDPQFRME